MKNTEFENLVRLSPYGKGIIAMVDLYPLSSLPVNQRCYSIPCYYFFFSRYLTKNFSILT